MRPEDIGIISSPLEGDDEKQPFMVAFLKTSGNTKHVRKTRETRRKKKTENSETSYARNPFTGMINVIDV